jgi:hypothetical protein
LESGGWQKHDELRSAVPLKFCRILVGPTTFGARTAGLLPAWFAGGDNALVPFIRNDPRSDLGARLLAGGSARLETFGRLETFTRLAGAVLAQGALLCVPE